MINKELLDIPDIVKLLSLRDILLLACPIQQMEIVCKSKNNNFYGNEFYGYKFITKKHN